VVEQRVHINEQHTNFGSIAGAKRRAGNCCLVVVGGIFLPSPVLPQLSQELHKRSTYKFPIWKNTEHKWKQLILVVNILFGLRVNEIPNKTFILDSHQLFICSVYLRKVEALVSFR
jgi:hypothetical protein